MAIPLHKAKDTQLVSNYRPISLLPVLAKFPEMHKILYDSQYGFRKGHSTGHGVAEFMQNTIHAYDSKSTTISVLLDLSKAFDTIHHEIIIHKLQYYGVRCVALCWFRRYLTDRSQYVSLNGYESDTKMITCGVPQGSVLGPVLFLICMNDLPSCITHAKVILFADDTTLYTSSENINTLYHNINIDLLNLVEWFRSNKLALNSSKTHHIT